MFTLHFASQSVRYSKFVTSAYVQTTRVGRTGGKTRGRLASLEIFCGKHCLMRFEKCLCYSCAYFCLLLSFVLQPRHQMAIMIQTSSSTKRSSREPACPVIIIIIMYIYQALINALSAHMIHINLNMIFYTHVEHRPTKTIYIKYYKKYI